MDGDPQKSTRESKEQKRERENGERDDSGSFDSQSASAYR